MTTWWEYLAAFSGPSIAVLIVVFLGKGWISSTLTLLVNKGTEGIKAAHQKVLQDQGAAHSLALEQFKQDNQRTTEGRSQAFQNMLEEMRRVQQQAIEAQRHDYSRSLEAARARIAREEGWFSHEIDALVELNKIFLGLLPTPDVPDPDWTLVVSFIEEKAPRIRSEIQKFRNAYDIFIPDEVRTDVEKAATAAAFCTFDPSDGPNIKATGQDVWNAIESARNRLRDHVQAEMRVERAHP